MYKTQFLHSYKVESPRCWMVYFSSHFVQNWTNMRTIKNVVRTRLLHLVAFKQQCITKEIFLMRIIIFIVEVKLFIVSPRRSKFSISLFTIFNGGNTQFRTAIFNRLIFASFLLKVTWKASWRNFYRIRNFELKLEFYYHANK